MLHGDRSDCLPPPQVKFAHRVSKVAVNQLAKARIPGAESKKSTRLAPAARERQNIPVRSGGAERLLEVARPIEK